MEEKKRFGRDYDYQIKEGIDPIDYRPFQE